MSEIIQILKKLCGYDITVSKPSCRFTKLLYKIYDPSYILDFGNPQSRVESYLFDIVNNTALMKGETPRSNIELLLACKLGYIEIIPTLVMNEIDYYLDEWAYGNVYDYNNPYDEKIISLSQPITLHGIQVAKGGNTVINGEQYISNNIEIVDNEILKTDIVIQYVFDGSDDENWIEYMNSDGTRRHYHVLGKNVNISDTDNGKLSLNTNFSISRMASTSNRNNCYTLAVTNGECCLYCRRDGQDTVNSFKSYLKTNPMTLLAVLKEPQISKIPLKGKIALPQYTIYNIKVNNDKEYRIKHSKVFGQSHQETTTGAQLFEFLNSYTIVDMTTIANSNVKNSCIIDVTKNKQVYVSMDDFSILNSGLIRILRTAEYPTIGVIGTRADMARSGVVNVTDNTNYLLVIVTLEQNKTNTDVYNAKLMINKGTAALPYEPYTGGEQSPNPDHPQEIISKIVNEIKVNNGGYLMRGSYYSNPQGIALKKGKVYYIEYGGKNTAPNMNIGIIDESITGINSTNLWTTISKYSLNESGIVDQPCRLTQISNSSYTFYVNVDGLKLWQAFNGPALDNDKFRLFYADGDI